ncbi:hypothetical protein TWF506_001657 [Arthrobotrys conoides]|uniref:Uncharacterized protein n=1 Tax=Arthrobotrys conoides TaxID=74498 RepID=A0AAN8NN62_9PEZI
MGRITAKEKLQKIIKSTWDYISPLTRSTSRPLHDFYNNPSIPNSTSTSTTTTPRSSDENIEHNDIDTIIITISASRAIEKKLVPEGTVFLYGDMVLTSYVPKDRDLEEVVQEWRKLGDVIVRKVGGGEDRFGYAG